MPGSGLMRQEKVGTVTSSKDVCPGKPHRTPPPALSYLPQLMSPFAWSMRVPGKGCGRADGCNDEMSHPLIHNLNVFLTLSFKTNSYHVALHTSRRASRGLYVTPPAKVLSRPQLVSSGRKSGTCVSSIGLQECCQKAKKNRLSTDVAHCTPESAVQQKLCKQRTKIVTDGLKACRILTKSERCEQKKQGRD